MTTLIVTASSKSKCEHTDKSNYNFAKNTFLDSLSEDHQEQLKNSRENLISGLNIPEGSDMQVSSVDTEPEEYLPAYIRYTGRTYSQISEEAWKALDGNEDMDMVILSALYGLMRYNEPVRNYDIQQKDKINGTRIMTYWKHNGAKEWLKDYILTNGYDEVKFVLSTSYSKIIQRDELIDELNEEYDIDAVDRQLKSAGRASMLERGRYIDDLLLGKI